MRLSELLPDQSGYLGDFEPDLGIRRRLLDLGWIRGTKIKCLNRSPLGDPTAYLVRGTVLALRREDAGRIHLLPDREENHADNSEGRRHPHA